MPSAVIAATAVVLTIVILFARVRVGFAVVVASVVLVPGSLPVHNPVTNYAYFTRVLVVALAIRLVLAIRAGALPSSSLRWTPVHSAFVVFLGSVFLVGVAFAQPVVSAPHMVDTALILVDQFLFFAVALASIRVIGELRWVLGVISVVLVASAGIGIIEHFTESSWGHFLYNGQAVTGVPATDPLEIRLDSVRVRAGAEYALQYGWVIVMLLPALLARLAGTRVRTLPWVVLAISAISVVMAAEYWSYSRTALASVGAVVLVTAVASRSRRLMALSAGGIAVCVVAFFTVSSLQTGFLGLPSGYVTVRTDRLPVVLQVALFDPLRGVGLGGLAAFGINNTDSSYLQVYGDTGIVGLLTCLVLLLTAAACCLGGLRARSRTDRAAAGAALAASLAMLAGGVAYDALRSLSSARPFWLLVALGVVATERTVGPLPRLVPRPRWALVGGVATAAAAAGVTLAVVPVHYAQQYDFLTIGASRETYVSDPVTMGQTLVNTVCSVASGVHAQHPGSRFDCRDLERGAGVGMLRIQAESPSRVTELAHQVTALATRVGLDSFRLDPSTPMRSGRPTAAGYALFWAPVGVLLAMLLMPVGRRRAGGPIGQGPPEVGTI